MKWRCWRQWWRCLATVSVLVLLTACSPDYSEMAERRLAFARHNQGDIHIVALQDVQKSEYIKGVELAAREINQRPQKLLGHEIHVHIENDSADFEAAKPVIRRIANNPKIVAVLGHRSSEVALPASVVYERSHTIFMPPFATGEKLTNYYFQYLFRMIPGNNIMSKQITSVAKTLGYNKIVILYTRDDFSREQAFMTEDAALRQNIEIINRKSFFGQSSNYRPVISGFSSATFDAVFIAAPPEAAGRMVQQLREMGVKQPILGSDQLNSGNYIKATKGAAENTIVPDVFASGENNPRIQDFVARYEKDYGTTPDYNAAQGYDSLMLLAAAIKRAGSTIPSLLSSTLHYMPAWEGVTGIHAFTQTGDMLGKKYFFKVWQNNAWHKMPAIDIPFTLERFQASLPETATDFTRALARKMHKDDHKTLLLDLAHEILHFKSIGIIYDNTDNGRKIANYGLLQALAKQKGFKVIECKTPLSLLETEDAVRAIITCYGKLALSVDALFLHPFQGLDTKLIAQLNNSLSFYKIPTISLDAHSNDPNITLLLDKRSDISLRGLGEMQVYSELLENLKVHEFAIRLQNLPELTVNLQKLQSYDFPDMPILLLSPEHYQRSE